MKRMTRIASLSALVALATTALVVSAASAFQDGDEGDWMSIGRPGPQHSKLEPLVGDWDLSGRWRMSADTEWESWTATSTRHWILGGRYVEERTEADLSTGPFEGLGLIGYDNFAQCYRYVWLDNMSTGMMVGSGEADRAGNPATSGTHANAFSGNSEEWFGTTWRIEGPDRHVFEMSAKGEDGEPFVEMEITYTRRSR